MRLIAISGGIGSGKSVISRMLRTMGYEVYDCDSRARAIMDADNVLLQHIAEEICREAVVAGKIDRKRLAETVFSDEAALERLNRLVHQAVKDDIRQWASSLGNAPVFIETAILYQSGIDRMVDEVWEVTAPPQLRLRRAVKRGMDAADARSRMAIQDAFETETRHNNVRIVVNDDDSAVLPQVLALLAEQS